MEHTVTQVFYDIVRFEANKFESVVLVMTAEDWEQTSHHFCHFSEYLEVILSDDHHATDSFETNLKRLKEETIPRLYIVMNPEDLSLVFHEGERVQTSIFYVNLLPNEELGYLPALRLDSKLFTFTMVGDSAMISELYAIKGQLRY